MMTCSTPSCGWLTSEPLSASRQRTYARMAMRPAHKIKAWMTGAERGMLLRRVKVKRSTEVINSAQAIARTTLQASLTLKNLETPSWRRKAEKAISEKIRDMRQYSDPSI